MAYTDMDADAYEAQDEPMDEETFRNAVKGAVSNAENWISRDISPDRLKAYRYYNGLCDYPPQEGRSQFVQRVVRDTVEQMLPQTVKIMTGGTDIVAFRATTINEQDQRFAQEATDAFNDIFWNKNPGFRLTQDFIRDALKAKNGTFHAYHKEEVRVREEEYEGSIEGLALRVQQGDVTVTAREDTSTTVSYLTQFGPVSEEIWRTKANLRVRETKRKLCIEGVPPEDYLTDENATGQEFGEYVLKGKRVTKLVSDVVEMGVPKEEAIKRAGTVDTADGQYRSNERRARRDSGSNIRRHTNNDDMTRPIDVYDLYMRVDKDGDGYAELRHIIAIGSNADYIHDDEIVEDDNFATAAAIRVEHNVFGTSPAENVIDLQDVETQLTRGMLNNVNMVENPRPMGVAGAYDPAKLASKVFGAEIEVSQQGAVQWLTYPFEADKILAIRESFDETKAERTGVSKESMGLAAQNLQASSEIGVLAVLGAGQTQPELIAANLAHEGFERLARIVIRLIKEAATDEGLIINTPRGLARVDPRLWPDDMQVERKVGLGTGSKDENLAALNWIAAKQEQAIQLAGADNPVTSVSSYLETLHEQVQLSGVGGSLRFFKDPEEARMQEARAKQQAAMTPPEPSEEDKKRAASMQEEMLKSQTTLEKQRQSDETDILIQSMKDQTKLTEVATEAALTQSEGEEVDLG